MADNFAATANRMMLDARILHHSEAFRNACYLAGYVVECTLKALIAQTKTPRMIHSIKSLHDEVAALLVNGNAIVAKYGDPSAFAPTMFQAVSQLGDKHCHWDPKHRYDGTRWTSNVSSDYLREAEKCHEVIIKMFIDGKVEL